MQSQEVRGANTPKGYVSDYVHFELVYVSPENSSLPYLPPNRTCIDTDPWMTAVKGSRSALQNEDAGCEGRFNSGFAISAAFSNLVALAGIRVPWQGVACVVLFVFFSLSALAFSVGAHDFGFARQIVLLVCTGTVTALICEARRRHAKQYSETMRTVMVMAQRSLDLLNTLIPQEVIMAATHDVAAASHQLEAKSCVKGADTRDDKTNVGTTNVKNSSHGGRTDSNICMELERVLDDVVMMFCSLPPLESMGTSKDAQTSAVWLFHTGSNRTILRY